MCPKRFPQHVQKLLLPESISVIEEFVRLLRIRGGG
jgi:hypothetical protein